MGKVLQIIGPQLHAAVDRVGQYVVATEFVDNLLESESTMCLEEFVHHLVSGSSFRVP